MLCPLAFAVSNLGCSPPCEPERSSRTRLGIHPAPVILSILVAPVAAVEGLYLAVAAINNALVEKNLLTREEIDLALRRAEQTALGDYRTEELSFSERDAMAFAPLLLALANNTVADGFTPQFLELAKMVGQTKDKFNDQQ